MKITTKSKQRAFTNVIKMPSEEASTCQTENQIKSE
jgi:hypothetical protein